MMVELNNLLIQIAVVQFLVLDNKILISKKNQTSLLAILKHLIILVLENRIHQAH